MQLKALIKKEYNRIIIFMQFNSTVLTLPGFNSSGKTHWQTLWENEFGFTRIEQTDWNTPICDDWVEQIDAEVMKHNPEDVILVAHSLACIAVAFWAERYNRYIKGALLVAPCDTENIAAPQGIIGFDPIPKIELPFYSTLVTSLNDIYVTPERAEELADSWGSDFVDIGNAGHVNPLSGYGKWHWGLELLKRLDEIS